MKSFVTMCLSFAASVAAAPIELEIRAIDPALVPAFGHPAGLNPTGTGDCDGITNAAGQVVKVPCFCPPDHGQFLVALEANAAAGHAVNNTGVSVSFPTDDSKASQLTRIQASLVTLQNLRGPGVGCPAASTTFLAQQKAIQDRPVNAGQVCPPAPPPPVNPSPPATRGGVDSALVPDLEHESGLNPTGSGDCDGVANASGQVIKVPCACPPDRAAFISSLNANIAAGHAVNNTSITVSFPTDNSNQSKAARITASLITLQNLRGPGVGCPAASTTLLAQLKAVQ